MNRAMHLEKLRTMVRQVSAGFNESATDGLEAASSRAATIEGVSDEHRTAALEGLRRLSAAEVLRDDTIDARQQHALEAIIMPKERPAVIIVGDTFSPPPFPWEHLGTSDFKQRIDTVIPSIGRVEVPRHPSVPYGGTGFVVGPNLLMTNRHVAAIFASGLGQRSLMFLPGRSAAMDFKREVVGTTPELLTVTKVVMIHPYWDMALLQVSGLAASRAALSISVKTPAELAEREVVVIGYPARDFRSNIEVQNEVFGGMFEVKRLQPGKLKVVRSIESFGNNVKALTHDASTLGGNSGSAVIDVLTGEVVALHFAGLYLDANFAVPMHELARDTRVVNAGVHFKGNVAPTTEWAAVWRQADEGSESPTVAVGGSGGGGGGGGGNNVVVGAGAAGAGQPPSGNTVTLTVPVHITVSIGALASGAAPVVTAGPGPAVTAREAIAANESALEAAAEDAVIEAYKKFDLPALAGSQFTWRGSLSAAVCSHLAYEQPVTIESTIRHTFKMPVCEFVHNEATECFVAANDNTIIVAFRGSAGAADWIGNLKFFNTTASYGELHLGFYFAFQAVKSPLEQLIRSIGLTNRELVVTGHSLGGALATVAAAEWQSVFKVRSVHTFGQPRIGKADFNAHIKQHYGEKFFRIVNDDDIATRVPPWYSHAVKARRLSPAGGVSIEALAQARPHVLETEAPALTEAEFSALQASLRTSTASNATESIGLEGFFPSFSDHAIANYLQRIGKLAN